MSVRPKKHLGQHFLKDVSIAERIAESLTRTGYKHVLEIGPGTGVLTQFLIQDPDHELWVIEVDQESIAYLHDHYPDLSPRIVEGDFLRFPLTDITSEPIAVAGNFPYNISSQILFRVLEFRDQIPEVVGMFQREVARRVASPPGSKEYGIISVLLQLYYNIEYLFTVDEHVFHPPPKVKSGVIRLVRNNVRSLPCSEKRLTQVVKTAFNQRRKTLRNSLRSLASSPELLQGDIFSKRPEQLGTDAFIELTQHLFPNDSPSITV